jgi:Ca2+-binding EF-hand superfamily protein
LNLLFNLYDTDQSGALDYKEFSAVLFGKASSTASPQKGTSLKSGGNNGEALAEKLKDKLATRGARGIIGLAR